MKEGSDNITRNRFQRERTSLVLNILSLRVWAYISRQTYAVRSGMWENKQRREI